MPLSNQIGIQLGLANFFDADMHRHLHHLRNFAAQSLDVFTFLADDDPGTRRVNRDTCILRRPVDLNLADRGVTKTLLQEFTYVEICIQQIGVLAFLGIPLGRPVLDDAKANAIWMYLLTHAYSPVRYRTQSHVMWLVRFKM